MVDIAIVGGMGTGKTTITELLANETSAVPVNLSHLVTSVPLHLQQQGYDLLKLDKHDYVRLIIEHATDDIPPFSRKAKHKYTRRLLRRYGKRMPAELALASHNGYPRIFDGVSLVASVNHLMDRHTYVAGLTCPEDLRIERCLGRNRNGDAQTIEQFRDQLQEDDQLRETNELLYIVDNVFDTSAQTPTEIANHLKKRLYLNV